MIKVSKLFLKGQQPEEKFLLFLQFQQWPGLSLLLFCLIVMFIQTFKNSLIASLIASLHDFPSYYLSNNDLQTEYFLGINDQWKALVVSGEAKSL